jgi:hypothetical protein
MSASTDAKNPGTRFGVLAASHIPSNSTYGANVNAPICANPQANIVPKVAGRPILRTLRSALLAMTFLASSTMPAFDSRIGFIAQTYPERRKNIEIMKGPEAMSRKKGR